MAIEKLTAYALDPTSPKGRHKARVFARALGLTVAEAEFLRAALLRAAVTEEALPGLADAYGQRYQIDFRVTTEVGVAGVRSAWIIDAGAELPRLVSCYIPEEAKS